MTRLALFDLDETLTDLSGAFSRWATEFAVQHRLPEDAAAWLIAVRAGYRAKIPQLVRPHPKTRDDLARLRAAGWRIGIVANGMQDNQLAKLHRTGLVKAVDRHRISDAVGLRKPDPHIFRLAARNCGTP